MGLFDAWTKGVEIGRDNRRQRILGQNAQAAMGGDQSALSQIIGVDPSAGMKLQTYAANQQKSQQEAHQAQVKDLGALASAVVQARQANDPARLQGTYAALVQRARAMGADVPDQFNDADLPHIYKFAAEGGAFGDQQEVPSAIRELQMLQQNPELAKLDMQRRQAGFGRPQLIQTADGYAWATPDGATPLNYGGGQPQQAPQQVDPVRDFSSLTASLGIPVNSAYRDPKHNAAVRGVPNSYHTKGQAIDLTPRSPQEYQQIQQWAAQNGYDFVDEMKGRNHVHLEPRRGAQATSGFGPGQRVMPAPKASAKSELDRRLELAKNMGASEEEQRRLVLGNAAPRSSDALGGKALPLGAVNALTKDAAKLTNLQDLSSRFVDDFAGNGIGGSVENMLGRLGAPGVTKDQPEWWQQYDRYKNEVRNELFGASLTAGEQAAFEAADITPNMDPAVVRKNLAKQAELIQKGLQRKARVWAAQGYNRGAIEEATGVSLGGQQAKAAASQNGWSIEVAP